MAQKAQLSAKERKERQVQQENLLIAIDQLEQINEVMTQVLMRIKQQVNEMDISEDITKKPTVKKTKTGKNKKISIVH